jgi:hypothetical protein
MGKSIKCKYRLEITENNGRKQTEGHTKKINVSSYIDAYIQSLKIGGANEHISKALGYMPIPKSAVLIDQRTGEAVDSWKAPLFMAF